MPIGADTGATACPSAAGAAADACAADDDYEGDEGDDNCGSFAVKVSIYSMSQVRRR